MAYKKGADGKKELYWKGFDVSENQGINLNETAGNEKTKKWRLTIFGTGTTRLGMLDGRTQGNYQDEVINCNEDVFEVVEWTFKSEKPTERSWEKPVTSITFKLKEPCNKKECDVDISNDVGLKWKPDFKPKAIF